MVFIIGGAYQGKLAFAKSKYDLKDEDIYTCSWESEPDWSFRCIEHLERYAFHCVKNGRPIEDHSRDDAILLGDDIFCGVVPIDTDERAWREETGRFFGRLCGKAADVYRLFCGLDLKLK